MPAGPAHHRFDRGSYVYLYHNAEEQQAKLEVANHAGTADQDAFHGYLDVVTLRYSHLQPSLVTLTVDTTTVQDHKSWHLPSYDQANEQKYMYKLYAIDIYLWTEKDAGTFVSYLRRILRPDKMDVKLAPGAGLSTAEHRDSMSPVVQQLERTAITPTFQPRAASSASAYSIPGPPSAVSIGASPQAAQAAPMAYNPAAPAAPEPIAPREKTPPPPDAGTGTGLAAAAKYDHAPSTLYQPQNSNRTTPQHAYFGSPQQHPNFSTQTSFPGPPSNLPPAIQQQRTPSFGPLATSTLPQSPPPGQQLFSQPLSHGAAPGQTQYANYTPQRQYSNQSGTPGFSGQSPPTPSAPPSYSGHTSMHSATLPPPPPLQQQTPMGGYSRYDYSAAQALPDSNSHGAYTSDVHSQVYRPTEAEQSAHKPHKPSTNPADGKPFGNLEGKVGKYLNKLDKLW